MEPGGVEPGGRLEPQKYTEEGASREVSFSERELNALLASNTDMAQRLAIDLSDDLASARLLIPLDPDFPILGGKTLRVNAGLEVAFRGGRPVAILRGVSLMGVPLPNAWLGNLKNVDLISEFGSDPGIWQSFAAGIEHIAGGVEEKHHVILGEVGVGEGRGVFGGVYLEVMGET